MLPSQRPRTYSFDGSLPPAKVLAMESACYIQYHEQVAPEARGSRGRMPRPIMRIRPDVYAQVAPNPVPPSHASTSYTRTWQDTKSGPYYAPSRQQDLASKPGDQYLKYMRLFESPRTLIPNCDHCLYDTSYYNHLFDLPSECKPDVNNYTPCMLPSGIPRNAKHVIAFHTNSSSLPGISMTDLLYQNVHSSEHERVFPYFEQHPVVNFVFRTFGYEDAVIPIRTVCNHGAITEIGLAYAIACYYDMKLQHGTRTHHVKPGHVYSNSRDHRLISLGVAKVNHPQLGETHMWFANFVITHDSRLQ